MIQSSLSLFNNYMNFSFIIHKVAYNGQTFITSKLRYGNILSLSFKTQPTNQPTSQPKTTHRIKKLHFLEKIQQVQNAPSQFLSNKITVNVSHFPPPPISHSPAFYSSSLFNGETAYYLLRHSKFLWQSAWVTKVPLRRLMPHGRHIQQNPCTKRLTCMSTEDRTVTRAINLQVCNMKKPLIKF